jgi:hypothetical protein
MARGAASAVALLCLTVSVACGSKPVPAFDGIGYGSSSGSSKADAGIDASDAGSAVVVDAGFDLDAACASTKVAGKQVPANLLFVIDRSGSMNCNPPPTTPSATCELFPVAQNANQPTKWSITRDAIQQVLATMPNINSVGISYFNIDNACGVQAQPDVSIAKLSGVQLSAIAASLDATQPRGETPIVGGVTLGYQHLHGQSLPGNKVLVLLTDGAETCAPDQQSNFVDKTVKDAALVGIRTFVIGAPGSDDARAFLSQIAFNGLTARTPSCTHAASPANVGNCHFDLTSSSNLAKELSDALGAISRETLGCEYAVPGVDQGNVDYGKVNVIYEPGTGGSTTVLKDDSKPCDNGANGWQYSADGTKIKLCGGICAQVKADPKGAVSIALGCATQAVK